MHRKLLLLLFLTHASIGFSSSGIPEHYYKYPFIPVLDCGAFVNKRFKLTSKDINKPVSEFNLFFNIKITHSTSPAPILDIIVTRNLPWTETNNISSSTPPFSAQPEPNMMMWEIRDDKDRIIRMLEMNLKPQIQKDGYVHYKTHFALPEEDLKKTFLVIYIVDIDGDKKYEDYVFEFDMKDFNWPKIE